jgi:glycerol-3-phosphate O-acyltransferase
MIRLALPTEPQWLDLPYGVRVRVRPLSSVLMETARQIVAAEMRELRVSMTRLRDAGVEMVDPPNLEDANVSHAEALVRLAKALARVAVLEWEGVLSADGATEALSPASLNRLMDVPSVCSSFFERYTSTLDVLEAEKNA